MNLYVASSWRSQRYPKIVALLRSHGYNVYDFKNTDEDRRLLETMPVTEWFRKRKPSEHRELIQASKAKAVFLADFAFLKKADALICVMPCGKSAHLEAGWAAGRGIPVLFLLEPEVETEPELMYSFGDMAWTEEQLLAWAALHKPMRSYRYSTF